MRDYALHEARSREQFAGAPFYLRLWRNWRARRSVLELSHFDDALLRDIGVTRGDVDWAAGLPITVNAALALEERSRLPRARRLSR